MTLGDSGLSYLMKKSETFSCFKRFKAWAETQTGCHIKALREDKGGEYMSGEMDGFCAEHGIQRQHSVRAGPQQNGVAERSNRSMEQGIISMLHQAGLSLSFWGEALAAFIHVWNRTPTSAVPGETPWETFYGTKPDTVIEWSLNQICVNRPPSWQLSRF
jgi:transposase InsO family protein